MIGLAFDVTGKHGFVIVVHHHDANALRYIQRALLHFQQKLDLIWLERFKVKSMSNSNESEFEYFSILKIKIPRGATVSALSVKGEIELRMGSLMMMLA
jgi:hypothetical protein